MATAWRSKWLDWTPEQAENISDSPENEVPKVTKVVPLATAERPETTIGTFGTDFQRASSNIPETTLAEWDAIFAEWTSKRCAWREGSSGSLQWLYGDCCEWSTTHGYQLVPSLAAFTEILTCLGFTIQNGFVLGLLCAEDACLAGSTAQRHESRASPVESPAVVWLRDELRTGERPISELDRMGIAAGHTRNDIFDAAEYLNLDKVRSGGKLCWRLWGQSPPRAANVPFVAGDSQMSSVTVKLDNLYVLKPSPRRIHAIQ